MNNKKILVTGGSGFIGASLIRRLVDLGNKPHVIVRKESNMKRLSEIRDKVLLYEADIAKQKEIGKIINKVKPQVVIHLASFGVYSYSSMDTQTTEKMIESNVLGSMYLFDACKSVGCELVINTGSCFEYGSSSKAFTEHDKLSPISTYGMTKASATHLAQVFCTNYGIPIVTLRPFTTYGPLEDSRRFMSTIIQNCLHGLPPSLTREVIVRDYIYIDDVIDAYIKVILKGQKLAGKVVNISTGKGSRLRDVANLIISLTSAKLKVQIGTFPKRDGEVISLIGSPVYAKKMLNWQAEISLEEGIKKTILWKEEC